VAHLLLVDDERTVHDLVSRVMESKTTHTVDACLSAWDALEKLAGGTAYDMALVDLHMPDLDGPALVKKMRAAGHDLKVLVVSGLPRDEAEEAAEQLGAVGWVKKPFDVRRLVFETEKALDPNWEPA